MVCLDIPDDYAFMHPELVALLERKVGDIFRTSPEASPCHPGRSEAKSRDGAAHS